MTLVQKVSRVSIRQFFFSVTVARCIISYYFLERFHLFGCDLSAGRIANRDRSAARKLALYLIYLSSDVEFRKRFRLHRDDFEAVLSEIFDDTYHPGHATQSWPGANLTGDGVSKGIPPAIRLAVTLRWLAGGNPFDLRVFLTIHSHAHLATGSYIDICDLYGVAYGSFTQLVWEVIDAIDRRVDNIKFAYDDVRCCVLKVEN